MFGKWRITSLTMMLALLVALSVLLAGCSSGGTTDAAQGDLDAGTQVSTPDKGDAGDSEGDTDASASASEADPATAATTNATDYSKADSWYQVPEITHDVDAFYICSTDYMGFDEGDADYAELGNPELSQGAAFEHAAEASVFEDSANLFIPYYRQASMSYLLKVWERDGNIDAAVSSGPYEDVSAALDYYFENYNDGRPFVIAGHSQGSAVLRLILMRYFKEHPEYYSRMVAAYAIGYSITHDDLDANPHLKFATGEDDTGVVVSWNTEGEENVKASATNVVLQPGAMCINPLNWKLDDTYAPASENLGSLVADQTTGETEIADLGADAQVNVERGIVVTNAKADPIPMTEYFGPKGFHDRDYMLFYNNIKANVAKRIAAYQANE